jgi:hypothetical protein
MSAKTKYTKWTLIDWDGNPTLNLKCWRKSFGRGHVSVGAGDFKSVAFSHGANSDDSISGTRWNYDLDVISEQEMMQWVDECKGFYKKHPSAAK